MRKTITLSDGWLFHEGDIEDKPSVSKGPVYCSAKTEVMRSGPASVGYPDKPDEYSNSGLMTTEKWEKVSVPHDYIISQPVDPTRNMALGGFHYRNAWYRYHFCPDPADIGQRIRVLFEGVTVHATVYCNGCLAARSFCGYTSFEADITDFVREGDNVLAVYVEAASLHEGWWYEGAGITQPVRMIVTDRVSLDTWGVYVHPQLQGEGLWKVPVQVSLSSCDKDDREVLVKVSVAGEDGKVCAAQQQKATVKAFGTREVCLEEMTVREPLLWDVDHPHLYTLKTEVFSGEGPSCADEQEDSFGFRTIRFDPDKGFFLNGEHVILKGVNCHEDWGLTGKAVPESIQHYKLRLFKEMGVNAVRMSHYPHSAYFMEQMSRMGFLVMDETRHFSTDPDALRELSMMVRRDRSQPCVILWSIGNEEPLITTPQGLRIARKMKAFVKSLDDTRPVTMAVCHEPASAVGNEALDVLGINYNLTQYDKAHERFPWQPIVGTETCATGTTRGWYFDTDQARGLIRAYDEQSESLSGFCGREDTWKALMARPYVAGAFQWDGVEHRGEAVYPRCSSVAGALDLFLFRKDAFYQNQSHWSGKPMVHLLPHWNFRGMEGRPIRVVAYTNCQEAELLVNGQSVGKRAVEKYGHAEWMVPYEPGSLEVNAYNEGKLAASDRQETTGSAYRLKFRVENEEELQTDRSVVLLTCYTEDEQGRFVPTADPMVSFSASQNAVIIGTGSVNTDPAPVTLPVRRMWNGLISVALRPAAPVPEKEPFSFTVYAQADGLLSAAFQASVG